MTAIQITHHCALFGCHIRYIVPGTTGTRARTAVSCERKGKTPMSLYDLKSGLYPSVAAASRLMDLMSAYPPAYAPAYGYLSRRPVAMNLPMKRCVFSAEKILDGAKQALPWLRLAFDIWHDVFGKHP